MTPPPGASNVDEFHQCNVCRALVRGPHARSPFSSGKVVFSERDADEWYPFTLTEADVRRIVREEIAAARNGDR